jgi:clan AA aspartic protease
MKAVKSVRSKRAIDISNLNLRRRSDELRAPFMGYVKVQAKVSNPEQTRKKNVEFLVDTGASYMVIPPSLAEELGLQQVTKVDVTLADKRKVDAGYAFAYVNLLGREAPVTVLVFESPIPRLGTFTLQVLGLEVDPAKEEVRPSRPFALGMMSLLLVTGACAK